MDGIRLGQGRDNAKQYFKEHPEEAEQLHQKIMEAIAKDRSKLNAKRSKKKDKEAAEEDTTETAAEEERTERAPAAREEKKSAKSRAVSIDADDFDEDDGIDV